MQTIATIDNQFYRELGTCIRSIREHRNMTQREVCEEMGISRATLVNWEYGYTKIKKKYWINLCKIFNIPEKIEVEVSIGKHAN